MQDETLNSLRNNVEELRYLTQKLSFYLHEIAEEFQSSNNEETNVVRFPTEKRK